MQKACLKIDGYLNLGAWSGGNLEYGSMRDVFEGTFRDMVACMLVSSRKQ